MDEIGSLVVKLMGDASDYSKTLKDAGTATEQAASEIEKSGSKIEQVAKSALQALAALGATQWLRVGLGEWQTAESTAMRLEAAIRANGRAVEPAMETYRQFASDLQNVTVIGDDTTLAMIQMAESMGVTGDNAMRAAKNAISLAAAKGGEATSYLRLTAALEQGNSEMLGRHLPGLRQIENATERNAEAQRLLGNMFGVAEAEARSSAGQMAQLKNAYGDLMEEVGKIVAETIAPVIEGMKNVVSWFQALSPEVKTAIVAVAGLTAGILAVASAIGVAGLVFNTAFGGVGLLIGGIVAAGAAIGLWVSRMGGMKEAWDQVTKIAGQAWGFIKAKFDEFLVWAAPIWKAIEGVARAAWDGIKEMATSAWEFIKGIYESVKEFALETWASISGGAEVDWQVVKDTIIDVLLAAEFGLRNFRRVWDVAVSAAALGIVKTWEQFKYVFVEAIPTTFDWFSRNWRSIFTDVGNFTREVFTNLAGNIVTIIRNIPRLLRGEVNFGSLWTPLTTGFRRATEELVLPERVASQLEQQLEREFDALGTALGQSWAEFRAQRLAEMGADPQTQEAVRRAGEETGREWREGYETEVSKTGKLDAVLRDSAEAFARILAHSEMLRGGVRVRPGPTPDPLAYFNPGQFVGPTGMAGVDYAVPTRPVEVGDAGVTLQEIREAQAEVDAREQAAADLERELAAEAFAEANRGAQPQFFPLAAASLIQQTEEAQDVLGDLLRTQARSEERYMSAATSSLARLNSEGAVGGRSFTTISPLTDAVRAIPQFFPLVNNLIQHTDENQDLLGRLLESVDSGEGGTTIGRAEPTRPGGLINSETATQGDSTVRLLTQAVEYLRELARREGLQLGGADLR